MGLSITSLIAVPIETFLSVRVLISHTVILFSASLRFVIFSSEFNMCDVAPESAINVSLPCYWLDVFVINRLSYIMSSAMLFADYFPPFSSCRNTLICELVIFQ